MARIENKNAPIKTEIDVWAPRSPTISATARGLVEAEAEDRALTRRCGQTGFQNRLIGDSRLFFAESSFGSGFDVRCRVGLLRALCG